MKRRDFLSSAARSLGAASTMGALGSMGATLSALSAALPQPAQATGAPAANAPHARLTLGGPLNAAPQVFAFGGGVWRVPRVMRLAEPLLTRLGEGGTYRAALAWELLAKAQSPDQAARLLSAYPLNDFLTARARAGGQIIVTLDATPLYLAADRSASQLADGPAWAKSPIASEQGWAQLCATIARHFDGLGIAPIYEVWNEPDHALRGSVKDYIRLYRASVAGLRSVQPKAPIAGPALSDWASVTPEARLFAEMFFDGAARTPVPQLGLQRLPIDVLTYHSFNRVPGRHHARVMDSARALAARHGYPMPRVINSEWNIAAEPPYPEGDLNGEFPGAAHVGASLISMARAGLSGQVFQMMVDPGAEGYHAGVLSVAGTPRAAYHAFDMARPLATGGLLDVTVEDQTAAAATTNDAPEPTPETGLPVIHALAAQSQGRLYLLIAAFAPTDVMLIRDAMEPVALADPGLFRALSNLPPDRVLAYFKGGRLPRAESPLQEALAKGRARYAAARSAREVWRNGGRITLRLDAPHRLISHRMLDQSTAPTTAQVKQADAETIARLKAGLLDTTEQLRSLGVAEKSVRAYGAELQSRVDGRQALAAAPPHIAKDLSRIDAAWTDPVQSRLTGLYQSQASRLPQPLANPRAQSEFTFETTPYALHLMELSA